MSKCACGREEWPNLLISTDVLPRVRRVVPRLQTTVYPRGTPQSVGPALSIAVCASIRCEHASLVATSHSSAYELVLYGARIVALLC